jgi:lipopolysaccharide/colanic/teichoic acid biosynthesis glycosyltransferase
MKRLIDILISIPIILFSTPIVGIAALFVFLEDGNEPFYLGERVGRNGKIFKIFKIRTMIKDAEKIGISSTSNSDQRLTRIGKIIRRFKIDELPQFLNVVLGQMSLVGPRPQVKRDVALYTHEEKKLLGVRPGITDMSSIIFSDEGEILDGSKNPDLTYNQIIRPWKSRFALCYINNKSIKLDLLLIFYTSIGIISRKFALLGVQKILDKISADPLLKKVAMRNTPLIAYPPPGANKIVEKI